MKLRHGQTTGGTKSHPPAGRRGIALFAVAALVLGLAPGASAAFKPLFTAKSDAKAVTISYSQLSTNDGAAMLAFYAPATYVAKLPTTVGTSVGTATANAAAADIRGATVPLDGVLRVASATTPLAAGSSATVGDAARACAGSSTLAGYWLLTLTGFNQIIPLAVGVQHVDSGPLSGGTALFVCPPPADLPAGSAQRAQLGLKIVQLTLRLTNAFTVPTGTHVWHLRATPYAPGSAVPNSAGAAEAEAQHSVAQKLTLAATPSGSHGADVSGRLTLADKGVAGQTVRILEAGKQIGSATTNASGAFTATVKFKGSRALLVARATVPARYLTPCAHPAFAPIPCVTSIVAGFSAASGRVAVTA